MGFDAPLNNREVCITFDRRTVFGLDANYCADADGRRGMAIDFIDEDYAVDITVQLYGDDGEGQQPRRPVAALSSLDALEVHRLVDEYLETHDPEPDDADEPDWDAINDERELEGE